MSYIYLVILTAGYSCCDQLVRTLRGFTDKKDAESYMGTMRHRISRNVGLQHAVSVMMSDMWDKANPALPCPPNEGEGAMEAYNVWCEKDNAHRDARRAEEDRLLSLVGWESTMNLHWEEEYDLHIQEVPLGFEVVEPPTEVAEAAE
jgi:hypothetical protein